MVSSFTRLAGYLGALCAVSSSMSMPVAEPEVESRDLSRRSVPASPRFVAYQDVWISGETGPPDVSAVSGYNVFAMAFLLTTGPADQALEWTDLTADQRSTIKSQYSAAGISLIVTAFGTTEEPTTAGVDATSTATTMGNWVIEYGLDGIDIDYEDLDAFNGGSGSAEDWVITFTTQIRTILPQGTYIVTEAPLAPWFEPSRWGGGGYLKVHESIGSIVDWYNIQFYNQGASEYTTCDGLLTASSSTWPETSVFEIIANGVDSDMVVIGKPGTTANAPSGGYVDPATLATCIADAVSEGWSAGVSAWQYPDTNSAWITEVRGSTFPVAAAVSIEPVATATATLTGPVDPPFSTLVGAYAAGAISTASVSAIPSASSTSA